MHNLTHGLPKHCFSTLPFEAQVALVHFFHFEILVWDVCGDESFMSYPDTCEEWSSVIGSVSIYCKSMELEFRFGEIDTIELSNACFWGAECAQPYNDFGEYHKDFRSESSVTYPLKGRWPVLLSETNTKYPLIDGWNRFHAYFASGHKTTPVVLLV